MFRRLVFFFLLSCAFGPVWSLTPELAGKIASGDSDERISALNQAVAAADASLVPFVQALLDDAVKTAGGKAYIVRDGKTVEAATGAAATLPADAQDVVNNNRMRRELETAVAALGLVSTDRTARAKAILALKDAADEGKLPLIDKAAATEADPELKAQLELLRAAVLISSSDPAKRVVAAKALSGSKAPATRSLLLERLAAEADPAVKSAIQAALDSVQGQLAWGERLGVLFTGASLGSILLLVALGLAITSG